MSRIDWPEGVLPFELEERLAPGDYAKHPKGSLWMLRAPTGDLGTVTPTTHTVEEHEDGTISIQPSLAYVYPGPPLNFPGRRGWHGFLTRGAWRSAD